jgi:amino acid transporter
VAILVQAVLATVFLLLSLLGQGTKVETVYLILLDTQLLVYFIPYIYLFVCFVVLRRRDEPAPGIVRAPGGIVGVWILAISGILITVFAMAVATIPPPGTDAPLLFRLKVIGGALGFIALGGVIYRRAQYRR